MMLELEKDIINRNLDRKVIYTRLSHSRKKCDFLYPPVFRDMDTDYICFTDDSTLVSAEWSIQEIENPEAADLEPYLKEYGMRWELRQGQVQMGPLWEGHLEENIVTIPALEELPGVKLDFEHFERTADEKGNYIYRENPVYQDGKYNGRPLLLTIGVPISNQINTIERCLNGIKPLLDELDSELVVVDTGSTDGTIDVCRHYGARIIEHPWHDNMSAVRNEGLYNARGQWYMSIDDDEWFENVGAILNFFQKGTYRSYNAATYIQRNYNDFEGKLYEDYHTLRMAEITPELHFEGRIHDALVMQDNARSAVLDSYAHHYGFVKDNQGKIAAKSRRNMSILPYDIYEYPTDLRYLFQLAQEYSFAGNADTAVRLFVQAVALAMKMGNDYQGKNSVMKLCDVLYRSKDPRLFSWMKFLPERFPLTTAEKAAVAWYQVQLGMTLLKPAAQIAGYFKDYETLLEQYRQSPQESRGRTFSGLSLVEHKFFIMDAEAVAFAEYIDLGREEEALALLDRISLDVVDNKRGVIFGKGFAAQDTIYDALCKKVTALQWEEWSGIIISSMAVSLKQEDIYGRQAKRFSTLLAKISVSAVSAWAKRYEGRNKGQTGRKLVQYAMECDADTAPVQVLCLCSYILKEAYVKGRGKTGNSALLHKYIITAGMFAEQYYNIGVLRDIKSRVIAPEIRAVYRMAAVLSDGQASSENITLLKQALAIFPSFHEEIRSIIKKLKS